MKENSWNSSLTNKIKNNGVVYTPDWIVQEILNLLDYNHQIYNKKIIDPACGNGAFLQEIIRRFILDAFEQNLPNIAIQHLLNDNIYGFDIDADAVSSCKKKMSEICRQYNIEHPNWDQIVVIDAFNPSNKSLYGTFDFVVGNPPYVRIQNLSSKMRNLLINKLQLCSNGSTDLYIAFFELGNYLLNNIGKLGFITPSSFITSAAGKKLRKFLSIKNNLKTLVDFEDHLVFKNIGAYTLITILDNTYKENYIKLFKGREKQIKYFCMINKNHIKEDNWILQTPSTINKINELTINGVKLGELCKIHTGIATLADKIFILQHPSIINDVCLFIGVDGNHYTIESSILKKTIKASTWKGNGHNQNIYTIFPYELISGKYQIIPEIKFKKYYPLTYKYLLSVKSTLDNRDKGKPNQVAWYAFGRSQGLDTSFGKKILTAPINKYPNFLSAEDDETIYYSGYSIKYDGDLNKLLNQLNSPQMEEYINNTSKNYRGGYKSYAKSFIKNFAIDIKKL